jgi:Zn-dependent peptidase ImmA (M78 family)/DNA-binding XRE family transcriptional regulator
MRAGTPGFSGARLREARQARGLSVATFAELVGVTAQVIYSYEGRKSSPTPDVLPRLAAAANVLPSFFTMPERPAARQQTYFRSMAAATKTARIRAEHRLQWLIDVVEYLEGFVLFPDIDLPDVAPTTDFRLLSDQDIEDAADALREAWRLGPGPVANMVLLLENHGVVVARDRLGADTLDGLSRFGDVGNRPFVIVGTDKGSPARWRFDAAHELGHLLLHRGVTADQLTKTEDYNQVERQAHRFASALLLPLAPFGEDLFGVNLDVLQSLKPKWNVSISMMIMRATHAGFISSDEQRRLWIAMSRRKWRTKEPLDDSTPIEEPRMLRRAFELLLANGDQTASDVCARLGLPANDIEALSGLPSGYLENHSAVALLPAAHRRSDYRQHDESGQVLDFRRP